MDSMAAFVIVIIVLFLFCFILPRNAKNNIREQRNWEVQYKENQHRQVGQNTEGIVAIRPEDMSKDKLDEAMAIALNQIEGLYRNIRAAEHISPGSASAQRIRKICLARIMELADWLDQHWAGSKYEETYTPTPKEVVDLLCRTDYTVTRCSEAKASLEAYIAKMENIVDALKASRAPGGTNRIHEQHCCETELWSVKDLLQNQLCWVIVFPERHTENLYESCVWTWALLGDVKQSLKKARSNEFPDEGLVRMAERKIGSLTNWLEQIGPVAILNTTSEQYPNAVSRREVAKLLYCVPEDLTSEPQQRKAEAQKLISILTECIDRLNLCMRQTGISRSDEIKQCTRRIADLKKWLAGDCTEPMARPWLLPDPKRLEHLIAERPEDIVPEFEYAESRCRELIVSLKAARDALIMDQLRGGPDQSELKNRCVNRLDELLAWLNDYCSRTWSGLKREAKLLLSFRPEGMLREPQEQKRLTKLAIRHFDKLIKELPKLSMGNQAEINQLMDDCRRRRDDLKQWLKDG